MSDSSSSLKYGWSDYVSEKGSLLSSTAMSTTSRGSGDASIDIEIGSGLEYLVLNISQDRGNNGTSKFRKCLSFDDLLIRLPDDVLKHISQICSSILWNRLETSTSIKVTRLQPFPGILPRSSI